jgi:hypothetical protein
LSLIACYASAGWHPVFRHCEQREAIQVYNNASYKSFYYGFISSIRTSFSFETTLLSRAITLAYSLRILNK